MKLTTSLAVATLLACSLSANAETIVNIDSSHGFTFDSGGSDPAPLPGQHINLIGTPMQLTLGAGTYEITNAAGLSGASFTAWSYNVGTSSWAWAFVVADDATRNVLLYGEAGGDSSAVAVAALPSVQNFSTTFALAGTTTLDFTLRDYFVGDNAGGISLKISQVSAVPEPASVGLMSAGLGLLLLVGSRRNRG